MKKTLKNGRLRSFAAVFILPFSLSCSAISPTTSDTTDVITELQPLAEQQATSLHVVSQLQGRHYEEKKLDDNLSSKVFDRYLSDLDYSKSYFLASDIQSFEKYRLQLDEALTRGNLVPAFEIYNQYHQRVLERLDYLVSTTEAGFDKWKFDIDETLETDRENAQWLENKETLTDLWRKQLKNRVLSLKLTDKDLTDIQELLLKRFKSQLNRVKQTKSEDAFQIYLNAFTHNYDPHTEYFSPRTSENFNINMSLSLEGIGAVLKSENEYTKVVRLVPKGPADKAGELKPADRIVGVAQEGDEEITDVVGWRLDEVVQLIRGPKSSVVRLEVIASAAKDDSQTKIIHITRDKVKLEEQSAQKKIIDIDQGDQKYKLGVIDIPAFYIDFKALNEGDPEYKSTTRDVRKLISELQDENIDGLVIDLRANGGGSLREAEELMGLFISTGPVVQVKNANGAVQPRGDRDPSIAYDGALVVLVDRLSASASEIFAGAIQDYHRGLVLGGQTFGKGTVQSLVTLNRGQLKLTQAKFYRISGGSNQNKGIIPDILYPALYDKTKIGESALENPLPWDTIRPAYYRPVDNMATYIPELESRHKARIKTDPDFNYLLESLAYMEEIRSNTEVSLNEQVRKDDRETRKLRLLNQENQRRVAKGLEALTQLEDEEDNLDSETKNEEKDDKPDALLTESANILADFIELKIQEKKVAQHQIK